MCALFAPGHSGIPRHSWRRTLMRCRTATLLCIKPGKILQAFRATLRGRRLRHWRTGGCGVPHRDVRQYSAGRRGLVCRRRNSTAFHPETTQKEVASDSPRPLSEGGAGFAGQGFEHLTLVIHGPPWVVRLAIDLHVDLAEAPPPQCAPPQRRRAFPFDLGGKHRPKPIPSDPHRLGVDIDAGFKAQVLNVPHRERVLHIHHHHEADDLGRGVNSGKGSSDEPSACASG